MTPTDEGPVIPAVAVPETRVAAGPDATVPETRVAAGPDATVFFQRSPAGPEDAPTGWDADSAAQAPPSRPPSMFQFPDLQPRLSQPDRSAIDDLPSGGKPNRKNITVEAFSGSVPVGKFDSGVRRWWRQFQDQLTDSQVLDGHRWSDLQCRSLFAASLRGDAADWYSVLRAQRRDLTLSLAGQLLIDKYKSKIPEQELLRRIMLEPKQRDETYQAYAQRLLNMAESLPGGLSVAANARQALHTFIKRAYYRYTDELKSFVERLPADLAPEQQLQKLVDHLSYMADSDGRLPSPDLRSSRQAINGKRAASNPARVSQTDGHAMSAVVEHKRKKPRTSQPSDPGSLPVNPSSTQGQRTPRCFKCKQDGHVARDCPQRQGRNLTTSKLQGSAAAALQEDSA